MLNKGTRSDLGASFLPAPPPSGVYGENSLRLWLLVEKALGFGKKERVNAACGIFSSK